MPTWTNNDGLYIKYGPDEVISQNGGEYRATGNLRVIEVEFEATKLGTGSSILSDVVKVPKGARIEKVEVVAETAFTSGGAATLNIGLVRTDRTTVYDADGLVAALALSALNVTGELNTLSVGSTGAGAFVGTTLANAGLIVADYDTAAYTAGKGKVRIHFYVP